MPPSVRVQLSVHPDLLLNETRLRDEAIAKAQVEMRQVTGVRILRKSVDARHRRPRVQLLVDVLLGENAGRKARPQPRDLASLNSEPEVVIVGAGPAGLFCALTLAERGVRAVILDRGRPVAQRRHDVAKLSQRGELNPDSNYCFGEGGAGTFSDGKLYTRATKRGEVERVLRDFVAYGAPEDILVDARPHIGTNRLPQVIASMRAHLESAGQRFVYDARVCELVHESGRVRGVKLADGSQILSRAVVLATGHSAEDVYRFAHEAGVVLRAKPFAMGVRVEHAQAFIDRAQYGDLAGHPALGSAAYRLVEHACDRAVFSFCMCPGGFIVPAATSAEHQVVNGWSPHSRRGRFANSGFVVEVSEQTLANANLDTSNPFSGLAYQRALEQRAYQAGGGDYVAPAQRLADFVAGRNSDSLPTTSYPRGVVACDLRDVLVELADPLRAALMEVDKKIPGFAGPDAIAVGVESRTSAPLRIERDSKTLQAQGCENLYPAAEGAGYAGGIMSAALDGIRIAGAIIPQLAIP